MDSLFSAKSVESKFSISFILSIVYPERVSSGPTKSPTLLFKRAPETKLLRPIPLNPLDRVPFSFSILVIVLLYRPSGIFKGKIL